MLMHTGISIEKSILIEEKRLKIENISNEFIEFFKLGYCDNVCEFIDNCTYKRISKILTDNDSFYLIGYVLSSSDISIRNSVNKKASILGGIDFDVKSFLEGYNIKLFYSRNS